MVNGKYRPVTDVCLGGKIRVAFNQYPGLFTVDRNMMVTYPLSWSHQNAASGWGAYPYDILLTFFTAHQLYPVFKDNGGVWGVQEAGQWRGAVGMVRTDFLIAF